MYEQFRNAYMTAANDSGISTDALTASLRALDKVAAQYDFRPRELALTPYNQELPQVAKMYLVCKKIEGLADTTLTTYKRILELFFRTM